MVPRKDSESSSSASEASDHAEESLSSDLVVTKYGVAADIANAVLKEVISSVKAGVEIGTLCDLGDKLILEKTSKIFKKEKDVQKGIAMPTCVSVDNTICHFSPLRSEPPVVLVDGQIVKVDLGAHVDGYIATVAHTVVVGASKDNKVTGAKANVIKAAYDAMEIAIRMLKPEAKHRNMDITDAIDKIAAAYGVKPIENMLSHELKRNKIDGEKQIIQNPGEKHRQEMEKVTFERFEAYAIDILFSTGEGKAKEKDTRTTVFKKADEVVYQLKMKASRIFLHEALNKHGVMPFTLRSFEDEVKAKLGVVECEKHGLMKPYQVLYDKDGDFVAQFKATVLIMPNGLLKITGLPLDTDALETTAKLEDATLVATLNQSLKPKNKKKKPATKKDGAEGGEGKDETAEEKKEPKEASKKEKKAKA